MNADWVTIRSRPIAMVCTTGGVRMGMFRGAWGHIVGTCSVV